MRAVSPRGLRNAADRNARDPSASDVFRRDVIRLGLSLTAVAESPPGLKVRYLWRADAGYFLSQNEFAAEIVNLGRELKTDDPKLLWSYDPSEAAAREKRAIAITVITENAKNSRAIARTDFTLVWDGEAVHAVH